MHYMRHIGLDQQGRKEAALVQSACNSHKWVLFLDDDVFLHPTALSEMVTAVEAQPLAFMATGRALSSVGSESS
jgi:GT2 family glycosyltransferase